MPDVAPAWVFPGQGSQEVGMGRDLYEAHPVARDLFDQADAILDRPLSQLCFEGPAEELGATANAQPAIYVMSMACLAVARGSGSISEPPSFVSGHSMGEYSALAAAGAMTFEDGLRLVAERGKLTQATAGAMPGGMAAILGLDENAVREICDTAGVELCNVNAPGQIVIGGEEGALARALTLASERGARRAMRLEVAGAFHTSLMAPAVEPFRAAVSSTKMNAPQAPFVANKTGTALSEPREITDELVYQLTHPVHWVRCVQFLSASGVREVIEFGPSRVLTGLIKRIDPGMGLRNINGAASLG